MEFVLNLGEKGIASLDGEELAKYLLKKTTVDEEVIAWAVKFIEACYRQSEGNINEIDSPLFFQALEKTSDLIHEYTKPIAEQKHTLEQELNSLECQIHDIEDKNYHNRVEANNLEQKKNELGIFKATEKRALQEQIDKLRTPIEVPGEIYKNIDTHKSMIEPLDEKLKYYLDVNKRNAHARDHIMMKGKNYNATQPQRAENREKKEKATNSSIKHKTSFRDEMRPLKSIN